MPNVDELIALFAGVHDEDGGWITRPCYTVPLAFTIACQAEPASEVSLRKLMYGELPVDEVPDKALYVIGLGYQRFRQHRELGRTRASL